MEFVLYIFVNWINKPQEIAKGSKKTSPHFIRGYYNKIFFFIKSLQESE